MRAQPFFENGFYINLLKPAEQERYSLNPNLLFQQAQLIKDSWIIIDEVQKVPKLLDVVHDIIETYKVKFALTGSSSRKLKRGGANLLAGRAVTFSLFPLTHLELQTHFNLENALRFGTLPKLLEFDTLPDPTAKIRYLNSYVYTYIKEEILVEQLVRNLDPFRLFLPLAAQMEGEPLNYSKIAKQSGVEHKTIQNYYQILVETHLGSFIEPYHRSVRRVQTQSPKFYFFDPGVKNAIEKKLTNTLIAKTSEYGRQFESWFINECLRINSYLETEFSFSYLRTKDDAEIDLVVEKPNGEIILIEIKSSTIIFDSHLKHLRHFKSSFPTAKFICACQVPMPEKRDHILVLPWQEAISYIFKIQPAAPMAVESTDS